MLAARCSGMETFNGFKRLAPLVGFKMFNRLDVLNHFNRFNCLRRVDPLASLACSAREFRLPGFRLRRGGDAGMTGEGACGAVAR